MDEEKTSQADGKLGPGNRGDPGHPRSFIMDAVTDDDINQIAEMMVEKAKKGEMDAARWVLTQMKERLKDEQTLASLAASFRR